MAIHTTLLFIMFFSSSSHANAITPYKGFVEVGQASYTWFGIEIYRASFWTPNGVFDGLESTTPYALKIKYSKNIKSSRLVETTKSEWEKLGIEESPKTLNWLELISKIWPDVKPDDTLLTLVIPNSHTEFFYNDHPIGRVNDPAFGGAFLSIWLGEKTSESELRKRLINANS